MLFRFLIKGKKLACVVVCGKSAGKMFAIEGSACFHPAENCHMEFQVIILSDKNIKKQKIKKIIIILIMKVMSQTMMMTMLIKITKYTTTITMILMIVMIGIIMVIIIRI